MENTNKFFCTLAYFDTINRTVLELRQLNSIHTRTVAYDRVLLKPEIQFNVSLS